LGGLHRALPCGSLESGIERSVRDNNNTFFVSDNDVARLSDHATTAHQSVPRGNSVFPPRDWNDAACKYRKLHFTNFSKITDRAVGEVTPKHPENVRCEGSA
jgi:hypothetical protein